MVRALAIISFMRGLDFLIFEMIRNSKISKILEFFGKKKSLKFDRAALVSATIFRLIFLDLCFCAALRRSA